MFLVKDHLSLGSKAALRRPASTLLYRVDSDGGSANHDYTYGGKNNAVSKVERALQHPFPDRHGVGPLPDYVRHQGLRKRVDPPCLSETPNSHKPG